MESGARTIGYIEKTELINDVRSAITNRTGFAIGKIGFSEQLLVGYPLLLKSNAADRQTKAYLTTLRFHCERQFGVFPTDPHFLQLFANKYVEFLGQIDILGVTGAGLERILIEEHRIKSKLIPYILTEPDRSFPENRDACYLPFFEGRNILVVSPFASFIKVRATREIFEGVWSNTGKRWFNPSDVQDIEIPYSIATETNTIKDFGTVLNLFKNICDRIEGQNFDIALIGAGVLGIPLAAYVKKLGKIGISLGGHLQVTFGISGNRWRNDAYWKENYMNGWWVDLPERYHPKNKELLSDKGAYW